MFVGEVEGKMSGMKIECPVCASGDIRRLADLSPVHLVERWERDIGVDVGDCFRNIESILLGQCGCCGLQFFWPAITGSGDFYGELQKYPWYYMDDKWEHQVALAQIPRGGNVCEVGCGKGAFVDRVNKRGYGSAIGLETSAEAVAGASAQGIPVQCVTVEEYAHDHGGEYDVVCTFQVLEHVADPRGFVEAAGKLLKKGGRMILSVPNRDSFIKWCDWVLDTPPHHVTRWSDQAMVNLCRLAGLTRVHIRHEHLQAYHADAYLAAWVLRMRSRPFGRILCHWRVKRALRRLLEFPACRKWIRGHTLYVSGIMPE